MDIKDEIVTYDSFRHDIEENNSLFKLKEGCFGVEPKIEQSLHYLYDFLNYYWGRFTKWKYTDIAINTEHNESLDTFWEWEMFFNAFVSTYYDTYDFETFTHRNSPKTIMFFVKVLEINDNSIIVSGMPPINDIDINKANISIDILTKNRRYDFIERENIVLDYTGSYEIGVLYLDNKTSGFKKNEYIKINIDLSISDLVKIEHKILDSEDD